MLGGSGQDVDRSGEEQHMKKYIKQTRFMLKEEGGFVLDLSLDLDRTRKERYMKKYTRQTSSVFRGGTEDPNQAGTNNT